MFSEELKKLIDAAFVDGILTDKERSVIIKRAVAEGHDPDEVEMILDAEVQKRTSGSYHSKNDATVTSKIIEDLTNSIGEIEKEYSGIEADSEIRRRKDSEIADVIRTLAIPSAKSDLVVLIPYLKTKWLNTNVIMSNATKSAYKQKFKESLSAAASLYPNDAIFNSLIEEEKNPRRHIQFKRKSLVELFIIFFAIIFILIGINTCGKSKDKENDNVRTETPVVNRVYNSYQEAARAHDFESAHKILDKMLEKYHNKRVKPYSDSWFSSNKRHRQDEAEKKELLEAYQEAVEYVFNAEVLYLCSLGDKGSLDRIIYLLSEIKIEGTPITENTAYDDYYDIDYSERENHQKYVSSVSAFNSKCEKLIDMAIANHNYYLAEKVLPVYKSIPDRLEKGKHIIHYSNIDKEKAVEKINKAIDDGVFPNVTEHYK